MTTSLAARLLKALRGEVLRDEPMARHTSLKVGGPADCFVVPADLDDLRELLRILGELGAPYLVVGGGYNLLVRDGGVRGVVISLARFQTLEVAAGGIVKAGAGVINQQFVRFTCENGLSGLEFLCGIPGTVGGAIGMNAGAHGGAILDHLGELITLRNGKLVTTAREALGYGYRHLDLAPGEIIVEATFRLTETGREEIEKRIAAFMEQRGKTQKVGLPSAGSFFKNPEGDQAWRLIDAAELRGRQIGGAQVSEVHANFLVNRGGATAADFLELVDCIKEEVRSKTGTALEEEVRIVGESNKINSV